MRSRNSVPVTLCGTPHLRCTPCLTCTDLSATRLTHPVCRLADAGVHSVAQRHRLLYSAAQLLEERKRLVQARATRWPLVSLLIVSAAAASSVILVTAMVLLAACAPARQAALTLGAVAASEVRRCGSHARLPFNMQTHRGALQTRGHKLLSHMLRDGCAPSGCIHRHVTRNESV